MLFSKNTPTNTGKDLRLQASLSAGTPAPPGRHQLPSCACWAVTALQETPMWGWEHFPGFYLSAKVQAQILPSALAKPPHTQSWGQVSRRDWC